jgi:hypothetical protein
MTDEKNREEGEVTDEQLADVSGGTNTPPTGPDPSSHAQYEADQMKKVTGPDYEPSPVPTTEPAQPVDKT